MGAQTCEKAHAPGSIGDTKKILMRGDAALDVASLLWDTQHSTVLTKDKRMAREKFDWTPVLSWVAEGGFVVDGTTVTEITTPGAMKLARAAYEKMHATPEVPGEKKERSYSARSAHFLLVGSDGEVISRETIDNNKRIERDELGGAMEALSVLHPGSSVLCVVESASGLSIEGVSLDDLLVAFDRS